MADAESYRRIAARLNALEARLNTLSTFGHRVQSIAPYWSLGGLRALWPMGSVDYQAAPQAADVAGFGYHLDNINGAQFGYERAAPYVNLNGVNQYLRRLDGGAGNWADILGTEAYISPADRGLTLGGWFRFDRLTNHEMLCGKSTAAAGTSSYHLVFRGVLAGDPVRMEVSTGAAFVTATVSPGIAATSWTFVAGRYDPGTEVKVYVGIGDASPLQTGTQAAGVPAALPDTGTSFTVGSYQGGLSYLDGFAAYVFLCATQLEDDMITALYSQTRALFGV